MTVQIRGGRRTPGLRRQEVAQLAGLSVDYYIRLEQARGQHPSRQVLAAPGSATEAAFAELSARAPLPALPSRAISGLPYRGGHI